MAVCASCRATFEFDPRFYEQRRIHPPARCRRCREERAERLIEKIGEVVRVNGSTITIENMGRRFIAFMTGGDTFPVGAKVAFGVDPGAPVPGGGLPVAKQVRRLA